MNKKMCQKQSISNTLKIIISYFHNQLKCFLLLLQSFKEIYFLYLQMKTRAQTNEKNINETKFSTIHKILISYTKNI